MHNSTMEYFNSLAERWDGICHHDPHKISAIVTLAGVKPGDRVLDIACGTGIMTAPLLARNPREVLGVDFAQKMIEKATEKFQDTRIRFAASDFFDLSDKGFDVAVLYSGYPHFTEKDRLAAHMAALLKQGGRFVIAHSESREAINRHHSGSAKSVSQTLRSAHEEALYFEPFFAIDILVDTQDIYVISGIKL